MAKIYTNSSVIYALRRCGLHPLHCSPLFSVARIFRSAAYVAYLAPDIDVVRGGTTIPGAAIDRFCWLNVRFIITVRRSDLYQLMEGDPLDLLDLQENCFLDCEYGR